MTQKKENEPDLYTLVDDEGVEQKYELIDVIETDNQLYYALLPHTENPVDPDSADDFLVILKKEIVNGEEVLASIQDHEEFVKIGQMVLKKLTQEK